MPRRREVIDQSRQPPPPAPDEFFAQDENVTRLLIEQAGGVEDAMVKVYKCGGPQPGGGRASPTIRDAWLYQCAPNEFDEEQLQSGYGPGKYRLRMYGTRPDGNYGVLLNRILDIGPLPPWRANDPKTLAASGNVSVNVPGNSGDGIAKAIAETLAPVLGAMVAMMQKMNGAPSETDIIAKLKAYKELFVPAAPANAAPLEGLKTILELARNMNEDRIEDPDSAPYKLLGKGIDVFQKLIEKANQGGNGAAPATPAIAAPVAEPGAAAAPAGSSEEEMLKVLFDAQLKTFLDAAKDNDDDYEFYATLLYKRAPDEFLEALKSDTWFAQLCTMSPEFAQYQSWCGEVRSLVIEMLKDDEPAAEPSTLTVPAKEPTVAPDGPAKK